MKIIYELGKDEQGAVVAEYGLLLAIMSIAVVTSMQSLNDSIVRLFESATRRLSELV